MYGWEIAKLEHRCGAWAHPTIPIHSWSQMSFVCRCLTRILAAVHQNSFFGLIEPCPMLHACTVNNTGWRGCILSLRTPLSSGGGARYLQSLFGSPCTKGKAPVTCSLYCPLQFNFVLNSFRDRTVFSISEFCSALQHYKQAHTVLSGSQSVYTVHVRYR